ncbi:MAG: asparagine synthase (glutamine-hydrolyzing) [bacterium]
MCGFIGFTSKNDKKLDEALSVIKHRGPDSSGKFSNDFISMGHNRLSIIDLSEKGSQPMANEEGDLVIVFNGEIYNFKELRESFPKNVWNFRSNSDTEVILCGYKLYGVDFFSKMRGMWALAIYDKKEKKVVLSRDYFGIKPVCYAIKDNILYFSSEIKALTKIIDNLEPNTEYYWQYFNLGYFIAPHTCYKSIKKICPGEIAIWDLEKKSISFNQINISANTSSSYISNVNEAVAEIEKQFLESVKAHFIADVPVGILLSGGNDSSMLAALSCAIGKKPLAFNLNIHDNIDYKYAKNLSSFLGLRFISKKMTNESLELQYEKIWDFVDEPTADSSIIPTSLVYSSISNKAKVVLSGEGGDELFGGYLRHNYFKKLKNIKLNNRIVETLCRFEDISEFSLKYKNPVINRVRNWLLNNTMDDLIGSYLAYTKIMDFPVNPKKIRKFLFDFYYNFNNKLIQKPLNLFFDRWLYLPNDLMYKNDISSMAYSIEARVPFLDKVLFNAVLKINSDFCLSPNFSEKFILKKIMEKYLPYEMIYRPKKGFSFSFKNYKVEGFKNDLKKALIFHKNNAATFGLANEKISEVYSPNYAELLINKFQGMAFAIVSNWKIFNK